MRPHVPLPPSLRLPPRPRRRSSRLAPPHVPSRRTFPHPPPPLRWRRTISLVPTHVPPRRRLRLAPPPLRGHRTISLVPTHVPPRRTARRPPRHAPLHRTVRHPPPWAPLHRAFRLTAAYVPSRRRLRHPPLHAPSYRPLRHPPRHVPSHRSFRLARPHVRPPPRLALGRGQPPRDSLRRRPRHPTPWPIVCASERASAPREPPPPHPARHGSRRERSRHGRPSRWRFAARHPLASKARKRSPCALPDPRGWTPSWCAEPASACAEPKTTGQPRHDADLDLRAPRTEHCQRRGLARGIPRCPAHRAGPCSGD